MARRIAKPRPPLALERSYQRLLLERNRRMQKRLAAALGPVLREMEKQEEAQEEQGQRTDALDPGGLARLLFVVQDIEAQPAPIPEASITGIGKAVDTQATGQIKQALAARKAVFPVDVLKPYSGQGGLLEGWLTQNVDLIKSIDETMFQQVREVVSEAYSKGTNTRALSRQIQERFGVSDSRARLIARDQVGKLNGQITKERATELRSEKYIWSASGDERVRPMHQALDGTIQEWGKPPIVSEDGRREEPGGDYQCRCQGIPILPGEDPQELLDRYGYDPDTQRVAGEQFGTA